jgi:Flp pilus assembly protein TadB
MHFAAPLGASGFRIDFAHAAPARLKTAGHLVNQIAAGLDSWRFALLGRLAKIWSDATHTKIQKTGIILAICLLCLTVACSGVGALVLLIGYALWAGAFCPRHSRQPLASRALMRPY